MQIDQKKLKKAIGTDILIQDLTTEVADDLRLLLGKSGIAGKKPVGYVKSIENKVQVILDLSAMQNRPDIYPKLAEKYFQEYAQYALSVISKNRDLTYRGYYLELAQQQANFLKSLDNIK